MTSNDTPPAVAGRTSASLDHADAALRADPLALGATVFAPNTRTFTLNSAEGEAALLAPASRPWMAAGSLPREPRRPRDGDQVSVNAGTDGEAAGAFGEWQRHIEAGRITVR
ncbi:MAG: hypothetical protein ABIO43_12755 [Sphingomicrobium sp.]